MSPSALSLCLLRPLTTAAGQGSGQLSAWGEGTGPRLNINSRANTGSWDRVVPPPWLEQREGEGGGVQEKNRWILVEQWPHLGRKQLRPSKETLDFQPDLGREEPDVG